MICLCLDRPTLAENRKIMDLAQGTFSMVELRADKLDSISEDELHDFIRAVPYDLVFTLREPVDGGLYTGSEEDRLHLTRIAIDAGSAWIDCEAFRSQSFFARMEELIAGSQTRLVVSFHEFQGMGIDPFARMTALRSQFPGALIKAALTPRNSGDFISLLDLADRLGNQHPFVVLGMGEWGSASRILYRRFGSEWTYASNPEAGAPPLAPGQYTSFELSRLYRAGSWTPDWKIFAVTGNPIHHSKSPEIHNQYMIEKGIRGVYIRLQTEVPEDIVTITRKLPLAGLSVTIPHKETLIPLLDETDDAVQQIHACNCVVNAEDRLCGYNTDAPGFLGPIDEMLGCGWLTGRSVSVLGAGGAARAVVWALKNRKARVVVFNRSPERARTLAAEFGVESAPWEDWETLSRNSDLIVQTTSLGMHPNTDDPAAGYSFTGSEVVYDIVYTPENTPILKRAAAAGCRIIYGKRMLESQAETAGRLFYRTDIPG